MFIVTMLIVSGCITIRPNVEVPSIDYTEIKKLIIKNPVTFRNVRPNTGDTLIGKWSFKKRVGNLHEYTEATIGTAKIVLKEQGIPVNDNAEKILELAILNALAKRGALEFTFTTKLIVKTNSGLEKEFKGIATCGNGWAITVAIEEALAQCVVKMLNDEDIRKYIED